MRRPGDGVGGGGGGAEGGGGGGGGERPEQEQRQAATTSTAHRDDDDPESSSASASDGGDSNSNSDGDRDGDFETDGRGAAASTNGRSGDTRTGEDTPTAAAVTATGTGASTPTTPSTPLSKALAPSGGVAAQATGTATATATTTTGTTAGSETAAAGAATAAAPVAGGGEAGGAGGSGGPGAAAGVEAGAGASPRAPPAPRDPAAPTALERVLEQLGILPQSRGGEAAAAAEMENKYRAVALAARADSQTLGLRMERQARLREQAERNVTAEADELARALHRLNYLCKEAESVELLGAAREQIHFVLRASKYVAATAETMGALRLEARMSAWMEASLSYADGLKQQLETVRSEHEELRRVITESGASLDTNISQGTPRRLLLTNKLLSSPRRASIAVPTRPATSVSPGTGIKDQARLSLAFIPGTNTQSTAVLRTGRRPLSSSSSDTTVGVSGSDSAAPSPPIVPEDFQPLVEDAVQTPLEEDVVDLGSGDEQPPHRNSIPRLSTAGLPDSEREELSVSHVRRRESSVVNAITAISPPVINPVQSARSLYRTTAAELLEYVWPPDFLVMAQHARWLVVRLLVLAAAWCVVQAFMSPADAHMQYSSPFSPHKMCDSDPPEWSK